MQENKKETRGGANNTRPQRGEKKITISVTITPKDQETAKKLFGGPSKAIVWAIENFKEKK